MDLSQHPSSRENVDRGKDNDNQQGVPDAARTKTREIHDAVREAVGGVHQVKQQCLSTEPYKSVPHGQMEGRRNGFRHETKDAARLRAEKGKCIVQVFQDDPGIVQRTDEE
jgi:hypothetical protein